MPTRRDQPDPHAAAPQTPDQGHRVLVDLRLLAGEFLAEQFILACSEAGHRPRGRRICRGARRDGDAAGAQELGQAVLTRPAVDEATVVVIAERVQVGWSRGGYGCGARIREHVVEESPPGGQVKTRRIGDHPVHVEEHGLIGRILADCR